MAVRRDATDRVIAGVCDVEDTITIDRQARGRIESGTGAVTVGKAARATGQRSHRAVRRDAQNAGLVAGVGDEHRAIAGSWRRRTGLRGGPSGCRRRW